MANGKFQWLLRFHECALARDRYLLYNSQLKYSEAQINLSSGGKKNFRTRRKNVFIYKSLDGEKKRKFNDEGRKSINHAAGMFSLL